MVYMSRFQNVSQQTDTRALDALLAAASRNQDNARREPLALPFTKAELRQMILEIMG
jgi:hypothetical protein